MEYLSENMVYHLNVTREFDYKDTSFYFVSSFEKQLLLINNICYRSSIFIQDHSVA